jgi:hypothetical protein
VIPDYSMPRLPVPPSVWSFLLRLLGNHTIDPGCNYESGELNGLGFEWTVSLEAELVEYVAWSHSFHSNVQRWCAA